MNNLRFLSRVLSLLLLAWLVFEPALAAEDPDTPATAELEVEPAPDVQPPKRRPRVRVNAGRQHQNDRVEIGRDVIIRANEVVQDVVVIAGNAIIEGTVERNLVVVSGSAKVTGQVNRDLVTILGSATLGADADIGHDVVVVGGTLRKNRQATIGGQQTVVALGHAFPDFLWLQHWLTNGLFLARPFPPQVKWVWLVAGLLALLYLALALIFPRPVRACVTSLEQQPVASFFVGTLIFVLLGPLLFLLVVSLAGVLVIPFILCALAGAIVLGKIAVYTYTGQRVAVQLRGPDLSLPTLLLIGLALFYLLYMVPILGFAVWGIVTLLGLGAVLLAAFGSFRQETAPAYAIGQPAPVMGGTMPPTADFIGPTQAVPPVMPPIDLALQPRIGFWRRFCATFLDFLLLCLTIHITGPFFLALWPAYHVAMWAWKGTTIGGIVLGIKIVRLDGQPVDFGVALVRSLSSFFSAFALFLGFFWAGWDRERQAWHDKIAGTIVVKVPKGMSLI